MITKTADTRDFRVQRAATTMRHSVTESIRQAIALGHYKAGERMPERDLCEMTGVSRTLVREALRQLESEGLVVVVAHKGPTVARITPEQAKGVYQVREVLESLAAKLFAENASDQDIARITQALDGVREAYMHGDVLDRLAAKNHFYDCLVAGTGNEALGQSLYMINARTMILRGRSLQMPSRWKESLKELDAIIDALKKRDAEEAHRLARIHVQAALEMVLQSFESGNS
ncbi:MAG: GntR family transcriptional regulator [Phyllobacteriaceae bacterium]|mgnify:CR=1 FL=1|nr:GntR family transcriptional regulator [Nitratireductor sp.]MCB1441132.1 GntR family transcriptional regulator [Nitratireductor sp.]MCO5134288.1 GntR family transcriptional regulator [Phyllobacteriaceae bacterium]